MFSLSRNLSITVQRELVNLLYENALTGLVITAAVFSSLVFGFDSGSIQTMKVAMWFLMMLLLLVRLLDTLHWMYKLHGKEYEPVLVKNRFSLGVIGTAFVWSSYVVLFYDSMDGIELAVTVIALSAMTAGAASVLAPSRFTAYVYCSVLVIPISVRAFWDREEVFATLGVLGLVFWIGVILTIYRTNRLIINTTKIKVTHAEMAEKMDHEQNEVKRINQELRESNARLDKANASLEEEVLKRTDDIHRLSNRDPLTELLNRAGFRRYVDKLIKQASTCNNSLAVLFIDLDGFKQVNDGLGHQIGDQVLIEVAKRLSRYCEPNHLARWGGDEFVVLLPYATVETAIAVAQAMKGGIASTFEVNENIITLDATIGIAIYPEHGEDALTLIQQADITMFEQKRSNRGSIGVFNEQIHNAIRHQQMLSERLRHAIENSELSLVYQPIIDAKTKSLFAVEALLRWQLDGNNIRPDVFIPLAEKIGQMREIGTWVLHRACIDASQWQMDDAVKVSVNVSVIQLLDDNFVSTLARVLKGSDLAPSKLHLEVTESIFAENKQKVIAQVDAINRLGVGISIDDFGTGYSSLSQLQSLHCDIIKIDRSFVQQLQEGSDTIIRATMLIAREFDCKTVAEGVETEEQANRLSAMGVDYLQGYLYARPLERSALLSWYQSNQN